MAELKYSKEQIIELKQNKYVKNCTSKYLSFTDEFKIKALELDKRHFFSKEIFQELWFPEYVINTKLPKNTIATLRFKEKTQWIQWLINSKKWRKKQKAIDFENMSKDEKIEYLEAENEYLKELYKLKHGKYP